MSRTEQVDVVVVGAGAAGLAAAHDLAVGGLSVVVLEARDRVGGRILSHQTNTGISIELGAEFLHGGNDDMQHWAEKAGLETVPTPEQQWYFGARSPERVDDMWDRVGAVLARLDPAKFPSFGAWLDTHGVTLPERDRVLSREFVEGFHAGPVHAMSSRVLQETKGGTDQEQRRVTNGYARVPQALLAASQARGVVLHFNTVVQRITWKKGRATVAARCEAGEPVREFACRSVLVTVPLGVLKAEPDQLGALAFEPEISEKRALLQRLQFGFAMRCVLRFRESFWTEPLIPEPLRRNSGKEFGFVHSPGSAIPVWWSCAPEPILVGWAGGPAARTLSGLAQLDFQLIALRTLSNIFDCSAAALRQLLLEQHRHDWAADPFTRGGYSFAQAELEAAPDELARPVEGTLFFAGEATAERSELGTVGGALSSGRRAAREIVEQLVGLQS
jgi:monoamine oxidase